MKKDFIKNAVSRLHSEFGEILCMGALVLVLWLVLYPEFSITADCCRVVDENGQVVEYDLTNRELAMAVLEADEDEIVIKSKIWEWIIKGENNDNGESKN